MTLITTFNNHFLEFVDDVQSIFPNDIEIKKAKQALEMLKKANPKMIISIWKRYILNKYNSEIQQGNIEFFLNKDYSRDLNVDDSNKILESIERLRGPIKQMGDDNLKKTIKYIQNLTKICEMYYQTLIDEIKQ
jgi:hypothetical protein